jgi:hypothetical protein
MSKFDTKEELLVSIQLLFNNLKIGKLSEEDMETLVNSTRELHERALILRYKAYEHKIYGESANEINDVVLPETVHEHLLVEPEIPSFEAKITEVVAEPKHVDTPSFDMSFSLFDQLEETQKEEEEIILPTESSSEAPEPEIDNFTVSEALESVEIIATPETITPTIEASSAPKDLFDKMLDQDNSLGAKLMFSKIESLQTAFGLNEKLQIIRELFKGSSEDFTQAIQILDVQPNFEQAKAILSNFTLEYAWELDTPITIEFVQKIARRYA